MEKLFQIFFFSFLLTQICFAQWVQTNKPCSETILCFAVSGSNLFAGTNNGVFRSSDNGTSWSEVNSGLTDLNVHSLAVKGVNLFAGNYNGVFLSTNNGTNWNIVGLTNSPVWALFVSDMNLFAGTNYGISRSTDNGLNWSSINAGLPTNTACLTFATSGTNLFAGTSQGVFLSTNNGTSWSGASTGVNPDAHAIAIIGMNLFAATWGGVFLSTNNGKSWNAVNKGLPRNAYNTTRYVGVGCLTSIDSNLFAGTESGVYLSTNNGTNWTPVGLTNIIVMCMTIRGPNLFAGTNELGVFLSIDSGISWREVSSGLPTSQVKCLAVRDTTLFAGVFRGVRLSTNNGNSWTHTSLVYRDFSWLTVIGGNIFAGGGMQCGNGGCSGQGVFLSTDGGTNWTQVDSGITNPEGWVVNALTVSGTSLYAGASIYMDKYGASGFFRSTNNGASWTKGNLPLVNTSIGSLVTTGTNLFAGTYRGVFLSSDEGASWNQVNSGLMDTIVNCFVVSGANLLAGTDGSVYRSTNNGASWTSLNSGLPHTNVSSLAVSGMSLFAGTSNGVFLSSDNGANWAQVNSGLTDTVVNGLAISETNIFACINNGVWRRPLSEMIVPVELTSFTATANSKEVILNWSTATELNNQGFEVQRKFGSNNFVTIGSVKGHGTTTSPNQYTYVDKLTDAGKYFYRLKQIDFGGKYEYSQTVEVNWSPFTIYKLEQNYPNPFNPTTKISFAIPFLGGTRGGSVTLKVYDVLGNEVKTLVNKEMETGYHSVNFDANDLPSGVYFYQLRAGSFVETRKMLLLR
jgi:hypothetical protein